jgi:hypothetical protein
MVRYSPCCFLSNIPLVDGLSTSVTRFHILNNLNASITTQTSHKCKFLAVNERKLLRLMNDQGPYRQEHTVTMPIIALSV